MGDFAGGVRRRVHEAREALRAAEESGDQHSVQILTADLEEMLRLAQEHGITVDPDAGEG